MERTDDIGFGGFRLIQNTECFCYGIDAVILADYVSARPGARLLDLCSGNGIVAFICSILYKPESISGIEFNHQAFNLAVRSNELNNAGVNFICDDVLNSSKYFPSGSFDAISINPPYTPKGNGPASFIGNKALARHESSATLQDFFDISSMLLKPGGSLSLVHRPARLVDIMDCSRKSGLEAKRMRLVCPYAGEAPNLVLLQFIKGGGKELCCEPDLVVRNEDGTYTDEINRIYRR